MGNRYSLERTVRFLVSFIFPASAPYQFSSLGHITDTDLIDHHQLTLILDVLGTPTMEDYYGIKSRRAREYIRSLPFKKRIPFSAMFPKTSPQALDLLEKLLAFNPAKRITVEDALKHPYLEPYHDPEDEPTAPPIPDEFFDFDRRKDELSKEQLKSMLSCPIHTHPLVQWLMFDRVALIFEEIMR